MNDILILITDKLPEEVADHIYSYIPIHLLKLVTKSIYNYYYEEHTYYHIRNHEAYANRLIRLNLTLPFYMHTLCSYPRLLKRKKIDFAGKTYKSYFELLNDLCIQHHSNKCRDILWELHYET